MIICLIHIQQNVNEDEKTKIKNGCLISHLSPYNQLFINNINGNDLKITSIIDLQNEQIINKEKLLYLKRLCV